MSTTFSWIPMYAMLTVACLHHTCSCLLTFVESLLIISGLGSCGCTLWPGACTVPRYIGLNIISLINAHFLLVINDDPAFNTRCSSHALPVLIIEVPFFPIDSGYVQRNSECRLKHNHAVHYRDLVLPFSMQRASVMLL